MASGGLPEFSKVVCYIIADRNVLVFRHRHAPEAGIQVPAGTIEACEEPRSAAKREATEETGRPGFEIVAKVGEMDYIFDHPPRLELHHRHFILLRPTDIVPERWSHFAENHSWFEFEWMRAAELEAEQGAMLHRALEYV